VTRSIDRATVETQSTKSIKLINVRYTVLESHELVKYTRPTIQTAVRSDSYRALLTQ